MEGAKKQNRYQITILEGTILCTKTYLSVLWNMKHHFLLLLNNLCARG